MNTTSRHMILGILLTACMTVVLEAQDWSRVQLRTIKVADGLHAIVGGGAGNVLLSVGEDGPLLIDAGYAELTDKFESAIKATAGKPVRLVVNTHWHFDHVGGNEALAQSGAMIIAHESVRRRMSEDRLIAVIDRRVPPSPVKALPILTFDKSLSLHWNGDDVDIRHIASGHTDGDAIVHFRKANVLHVGDTWFNGMYPFIDINVGGSIDGIIMTLDQALALSNENTKIIPGHGRISNAVEMKRYRDMLAAVRDRVQSLIQQGKTKSEVIAAKPSKPFDQQWGRSWLKPDTWIGLVYDGLQKSCTTSRPVPVSKSAGQSDAFRRSCAVDEPRKSMSTSPRNRFACPL